MKTLKEQQIEGKERMYKTAFDTIMGEYVALLDYDSDTASYQVRRINGEVVYRNVDQLERFCL